MTNRFKLIFMHVFWFDLVLLSPSNISSDVYDIIPNLTVFNQNDNINYKIQQFEDILLLINDNNAKMYYCWSLFQNLAIFTVQRLCYQFFWLIFLIIFYLP